MDFYDLMKAASGVGGGGGGGGGCPSNNVTTMKLVVNAPTAEVTHAQTTPPESD